MTILEVSETNLEGKKISSELSYDAAQSLIQWANAEYQKAKSARSQIELQWAMNMAFYYGKQYSEFVPQLRRITTPQAPPWRVRSITNRIRPMVRTEISRLTSQRPNASVVPASSEDEDLFAAQAAEAVWESQYSRKKINRDYRRSAWWTVVTGNGFMKVYWDNSAKDTYSDKEGDVCYGVVTPFHLFVPDLREEELEKQPFVIHAYTRDINWVKQYWGSKLNPEIELKPSAIGANEILQDVYLNLTGTSTQSAPDSCLLLEVWIKPGGHPDFPKGGMITIVENQVVAFHNEGIPYKHGEYPYVKFDHIPTGKFYADSSINDLIPLQREYNRTRSQIIESKNRMSKSSFFYPEGTVNPKKITSEGGQYVPYKPGLGVPTPIPMQPLPAFVLQELDRVLVDMEDVSGQHEVSRGSAPPGVTAATAISFLQEKDDSILSHTYDSVEEGWEKIARQTLSLCAQYWDDERTVRVVGSDSSFDTMVLSAAQIERGTDIRVEGGSSLPVSKAARQALLMDFYKLGAITSEDMLKMLEIGGINKIQDNLRRDERQAQRENLRFKRAADEDIEAHYAEHQQKIEMGDPSVVTPEGPMQPPPIIAVNTWDNHAVHVKVHDDFRKGQEFESLSDSVKAELETHVQLHRAMMMQQAQEMAMSAMLSGEEPESGGSNQFSGAEGMGEVSG